MYENVIWEGRFQPIHKGHLAYIKILLSKSKNLWIYVVDNEVSTNIPDFISPVPFFTEEVDKHHIASKNPLPFSLRYKMVIETLKEEFGSDAPIYVFGGKRLDLDWDYYKKILPDNRFFLTPLRDDFENIKARAWKELGELVERIDVSKLPKISATMVRESIRSGKKAESLLNKKTLSILKEYDYLDKI